MFCLAYLLIGTIFVVSVLFTIFIDRYNFCSQYSVYHYLLIGTIFVVNVLFSIFIDRYNFCSQCSVYHIY